MFLESCSLLLSCWTGSVVDFHPQYLLWSSPFGETWPSLTSALQTVTPLWPSCLQTDSWLLLSHCCFLCLLAQAAPVQRIPPQASLPSVAGDWNQEVVCSQPATRSIVWKIREHCARFLEQKTDDSPPPPSSGWNTSRNFSSSFQGLLHTSLRARHAPGEYSQLPGLSWSSVDTLRNRPESKR